MKNKTQTRLNSLVPNFRYIATPVLLGLCLVHSASAAITTWTGAADDDWATAGNWDNGLPSGNDVIFSAADATGTSGPSGTVNNFVAADTSSLSLRYNNLTTTGFHNTRIDNEITLSLTGGNAGTTTSANPIVFVSSPAGGNTHVVYATIRGDGTLLLNNTAANMHVGQGTTGGTNSTRRATLDMSGLANFQATIGRLIIGQQKVVGNRPNGTILLAKTNTLDLTSATLPGLQLGDIGSNNGNSQVLELGTTNTILTDTGITIGGRKGNGFLRFNSNTVGEGEGLATLRSRNGTGRQAQWLIGDNSGQSAGGTNATGLVDFTGGKVDARVNHIILGRGNSNAVNTVLTHGTLTLDEGTIDASQLSMGLQGGSVTGPSRGTFNVLGSGELLVSGGVTLGRVVGSYNSWGELNIDGPTAAVTFLGDVVCGGGAGNKITLADGTLTLGGRLGDDSVADDTALETLQLDGGTLDFSFGASANPAGSVAKVTTLTASAPVTISVKGSNLSPGTIELIKYDSFDEANQFANLQLASPVRVEGQLVNNTLNGSIDLLIEEVLSNKWSGAVDGDWDIDGKLNWRLSPTNTPSTYLQTEVPGESVIFDDTATGTKIVNLTTTLSPEAITVDTAQTYTFGGSGEISGPAGMIKRGVGSLVIGNSGSNAFTGAINIEAGTIQLAGANDRLPATASVTIADVATAELDLNNLVQSLAGLSGGGSIGGKVTLGTGSLTLTGGGNYSGIISGSGALIKSTAGDQVLAGANNFSGGTTISGGRISVANATGSGLGSGPIQILPEGTLAIGNGGETGSVAATTLDNDGTLVFDRSEEFTSPYLVQGLGGVTKGGAEGTLILDTANTYDGMTVINSGAIRVTHPDALGSTVGQTNVNNPVTARLELSGGITLAETIQLAQKQSTAGDAPGLLNVDGDNTLTGDLILGGGGSNWNIWSDAGKLTIAGTATNTNTTNTRNLRLYGEGDGEIQSALANGAGTSLTAVFMSGSGTWTLSGNNTYTGATTVESGTLLIDGSHTTSTVTVNSGGTLGGIGTLGTVDAFFGTIAPGSAASPIGTLNAGNTTVSALKIDVAGSSSDRLVVTGSLGIDGAIVSITGTPTVSSYTLATATTSLTGTPVLADPIPGYELLVDGNTLKLNSTGGLSPYDTWAGGAVFGGDENGDGVSNGLAFLLGAANPSESALNKLPAITQSGGGLLMTFSMRNESARGGATLSLQHSSDLGISDAWTSVAVPDTNSGPVSGVTFTVTPGESLNTVQATISASQAAGGKLFGRLQAQNP